MLGNLLAMAAGVIPMQQAQLYRSTGKQQTSAGMWVPGFAEPVTIKGSIQPLDAARVTYMGFDGTKRHITIYAPDLLLPLSGGENPDELVWQGRRWRVLSDADWHAQADFAGAVAVEIEQK